MNMNLISELFVLYMIDSCYSLSIFSMYLLPINDFITTCIIDHVENSSLSYVDPLKF